MGEYTASGQYPFTVDDLSPDRLMVGVEQTMADFFAWRDANPDIIAAHIENHTRILHEEVGSIGLPARLLRRYSASRRESFQNHQIRQEIGHFCINNLAELPDPEFTDLVQAEATKRRPMIEAITKSYHKDGIQAVKNTLEAQFPELRGEPEVVWLGEQMSRLYRVLPDTVVRQGGMGKTARTVAGILAIGAIDTMHEDQEVRRDHLKRILPAAYAYGATYAIIDDTLQDSSYISGPDRLQYDQAILSGLRSGGIIDVSAMPDHPLAEELARIFGTVLDTFPFDDYRHLYYAGESMFQAQDRDARLTADSEICVTGMYPDMAAKASLTRVIANILGRRHLPEGYYARCMGFTFINQIRDDLSDYYEDKQAGRITPFTYPTEKLQGTNPLYDVFAYNAYTINRVFEGSPVVDDVMTRFGATRIAMIMQARPQFSQELAGRYDMTPEMAGFFGYVSGLRTNLASYLQPGDKQFEADVRKAFGNRPATESEPRTFITDHMELINKVISESTVAGSTNDIQKIAAYALEGNGKRLRPALVLMLAAGLGVDFKTVEPLIAAAEQYHTASLVFDDLPAQDNAMLRRGRPAAHVAYDEAGAQLAGIALLSSGFGSLVRLKDFYDTDRVADVIGYFASVLGPERLCLGQYMDLHATSGSETSEAEILEMYNLKTSTSLEASLLPLMMLLDRPDQEQEHIKVFAYHAGIVFQLRDDILDATAEVQQTGKDANQDMGKVNMVRSFGLDAAQQRLEHHLAAAIEQCQALPFDTKLLQGTVGYFANRTR